MLARPTLKILLIEEARSGFVFYLICLKMHLCLHMIRSRNNREVLGVVHIVEWVRIYYLCVMKMY